VPLAGPSLTRLSPIANLLGHGLTKKPDELALVCSQTRMTWRQLAEISARLAQQYLALGLKPGDRVASLMPNRPALVIHYLACLKAGLVATPLNYRYMPPEIDHALEVSGASLLLHHAERDGDVAESRLGKRLLRLEAARVDRDIEDENRVEHDPADWQKPVCRAKTGSDNGQKRRHPVHAHHDRESRGQPAQGRPMGPRVKKSEQTQKNDDRHSRNDRGD
jgi:acyl-CoA synthetase (AMP-forming)/AMP-acid ligase II